MDFQQEYEKTQWQIADYQDKVRGCMVFRKLKASEDWHVVAQWVADRIGAKTIQFTDESLDFAGLKKIQAEVRTLREFLTMGDVKQEDLDRYQREIARLQKVQGSRHTYGLDKNYPAVPEGQPT